MLTVATLLNGKSAVAGGVALLTVAFGAGAARLGAHTVPTDETEPFATAELDRTPAGTIPARMAEETPLLAPAALLTISGSRLLIDPGVLAGVDALGLADAERDSTLLPEPNVLLNAPALLQANGPAGGSGREWDSITGSVKRRPQKGISILQIGDSHTAADFFTGEVRRQLQARYGDGGAGYLDVGTPHAGVLSARFKMSGSTGWSYTGIQKAANSGADFALTGFSATAAKSGERLSFVSDSGVPYTQIDIEVQKGPNEGSVAVDVDGREATILSLVAPDAHREVVRVLSVEKRVGTVRRVDIRTLDGKPVTALSLTVANSKYGVTYSNIGFPGATVDILNKFPQETIVEALARLTPSIVVLAFGTNEGFNDGLDLARYEERYRAVIRTVRAGAPNARIVMIGPSHAERVPSSCVKDPNSSACDGSRAEGKAAVAEKAVATDKVTERSAGEKASGEKVAAEKLASDKPTSDKPTSDKPVVEKVVDKADGSPCTWPTPPQLDRVRDTQRRLAAAEAIDFWDWSSLMPKRCGAQAWTRMSPPLMTADHVHFTKEGYRRSGRAFAAFLDPFVRRSIRETHAVSNH